jgi:phosphoribosylamine--glycine ligase
VKRTKILVVGSGGREAAMVWAFAQTPRTKVFCAPGNAGIAEYAECVPVEATDISGLLSFALSERIDLTVVGPEAPLVAGIADRFREKDLLICGPSAAAARSEGSKAWFKRLLAKQDIPTAPFDVFANRNGAFRYIYKRGARNIVIKADGLTGGKGVFLPDSLEEAWDDLTKLMVKGSPGEMVVIEDRLYGVERSVMAITDGRTIYMLPFTQDYKRERDGDSGPNTGGMGAHTLILPETEEAALSGILRDVVAALAHWGCRYTGFIYLGFIQTSDGPMILECNCRLGDPETQVILPSISGDFARLCMASAQGNLAEVPAPKRQKHALCLVLASAAYPDSSDHDDVITGLDTAGESGALVLHAGTAKKNGLITTNKSGRVLNVVGLGDTLETARIAAYSGAEKVKFPGMKYRKDIGAKVIRPV